MNQVNKFRWTNPEKICWVTTRNFQLFKDNDDDYTKAKGTKKKT